MNDKNKTTNNSDAIWATQTLDNIYESVQEYRGQHKREAFDEMRTIISDLLNREVERLIDNVYEDFYKVEVNEHGIKDLIEVVCRYYNTQPDKLKVISKKRVIVDPKQLLHWMLKNKVVCNSLTLEQIGKFTGNQDHATVLHGVRTVNNRLKTDIRFREDVMLLCNRLGAWTLWNDDKLEVRYQR